MFKRQHHDIDNHMTTRYNLYVKFDLTVDFDMNGEGGARATLVVCGTNVAISISLHALYRQGH